MFLKWIFIGMITVSLQSVHGQQSQIRDEMVHSEVTGTDRIVHVYLPASYEKEESRRYPVLYVQDGQNIFSTAGTNAAFGWGSWQLDKTADNLARAGKMPEIIIVAVDNSPARMKEYSGHETAFEKYADFLLTELKPKIDREYRTRPGPASTGVMGSSLGGICSLALAWEHPEVFERTASLSGSFQVDHTNFLNEVLHNFHSKPKPFRVYLDSGAVDFTGGDDNRALTAEVAAELRRIGWGKDLMLYVDEKPLSPETLATTGLRRDKWNEARTSQHNEFYWRLRAWRALSFLFPPDEK